MIKPEIKPGFSIVYRTPQPVNLPSFVSPEAGRIAASFHAGLPGYTPTPLVDLRDLAKSLDVRQILVKDESQRFGLNAFKALGGSFAMARLLCQRLGITLGRDSFQVLTSDAYRRELEQLTFVTATDGNHGRGVAWAARQLGCRAVVYMPRGSAEARLNNIRAQGAEAEITDLNYDDAVRYAGQMAEKHGWILMQDTAWPGYEEIPAAIMQGYTTLGDEIRTQLDAMGTERPSHLFLQAGVGSLAGALAGYFVSLWPEDPPKIILVEPDRADCLFRTALADDGKLHAVTGPMNSIMAGLCCGEPCTLGWEILRQTACAFISCDDAYAEHGMRLLGKPEGTDPRIVSGESGAVTAGVAARLLTDPDLAEVKEGLGLEADSRILLISTEGDTDPVNYQKILAS
ncbi:MAG: diaminopropionate ammonia-lyase [Oscillospiraceae bacterium]|nr:diaminopropionate ammonia-lyase [Oscillospiraceae bacterium]